MLVYNIFRLLRSSPVFASLTHIGWALACQRVLISVPVPHQISGVLVCLYCRGAFYPYIYPSSSGKQQFLVIQWWTWSRQGCLYYPFLVCFSQSQFHICDWSKQEFAAPAQVGSNLFLLQKSDLRSKKFLFLKYFFLYLFGCAGSQLWHVESSIFVVACKLLVVTCGIQVPNQGLNASPRHWESQVLANKPPGKSPKNVLCSSPMG